MDKNCQSSVESTVTTTSSSNSSNRPQSNSNSNNNHQNPSDLYLKHLNKISHKISKPPIRRTPIPPLHHQQQQQQQQQLHHLHQPSQQQQQQSQQIQQQQTQQQNPQQQPPVYNINKSDFRDVVQKLTGSPAHDRFSTPPPIQPPKPQSSRLQRIRPPPLAHVSNRPPPPLTNTLFPPPPSSSTINNPINPNFNINPNHIGRSVSPLSPLPPFPSVHAAAESPISAYMRYLQSSTPTPLDSNSKGFPSPRWNNPNSFQQQQFLLPSPPVPMPPSSPFMMPNSPLGFGRISSPRSPYPLLSPSLLFSPTSGQLGFPQFPQSPRMPVGSPRWRGY